MESYGNKGFLLTESVMTSPNDVAGIRVVTSFIDDVYNIAEMLVEQY